MRAVAVGPNKNGHARRRVRCLGPGREHTFWSAGPGNRVCPRCRARLAAARVAAVYEAAVTVVFEPATYRE